MPTTLIGWWLLTLWGSAAHTPAAPPRPLPAANSIPLPFNPFPRANSVCLQTAAPCLLAMDKLVRYYQSQGYVVDSVDREVFFAVQAHTTLPLPKPVRLDVRASFDMLQCTVCLRATYEPALAASRPVRPRQVRYTTFAAPARRAAFLELQRISREAFPGALLTYSNQVP